MIPRTGGYFEVSELLGDPKRVERLHDGVDKLDQDSLPGRNGPRVLPLEADHVLVDVVGVHHRCLSLTGTAKVPRDGAAKLRERGRELSRLNTFRLVEVREVYRVGPKSGP